MKRKTDLNAPAFWRRDPHYRPTYDARGIVPDDLVPHIERAVANDTVSTCDQHDKRNPLAVLLGTLIAVAAIVALISAALSAAVR